MSKPKYTPGPWILKPYRKDFSIGISGKSEYVVTVTGMSEKDRANARLIASAPELLEALQECITDAESHCIRQNTVRAMKHRLSAINAVVLAAIAKAQGGQS